MVIVKHGLNTLERTCTYKAHFQQEFTITYYFRVLMSNYNILICLIVVLLCIGHHRRHYVFGLSVLACVRPCVQACFLLAQYLTNQWTEFHQGTVAIVGADTRKARAAISSSICICSFFVLCSPMMK